MDRADYIKKIAIVSEENSIPRIIGLYGKFLDKFYEDVIYLNVYERKTGGIKRSGYYKFSSFLLKSVLYFIVTNISVLRVYIYRRKIKNKEDNLNRVVYVAAPFKIVKARHLRELIPETSIYYYPISDMRFLGAHIKAFNDLNQGLIIDRFKFRFVLKTFWVYMSNYQKLLRYSKAIDSIFETNRNDVIVLLLKAIYASYHYRSYVQQLASQQHIWLLEYQSGIEMLALQNSIKEYSPLDLTVHMQHGTMLDPKVIAYNDPVTDYDIVCGEREARILSGMNKYQSKLLSLGCPIQSMGYINFALSGKTKFDILVLLSDADKPSTIRCQSILLNKLSERNDLKVLLRFRPASQIDDEKVLHSYIKGMTVSRGTSLDEDIAASNIVLTFSADALYHCFRQGKKSVLIVHERYIEEEFTKCNMSSKNFKVSYYETFDLQDINSMIKNREIVDYREDRYVKFNFGNIDTLSYKQELDNFFNSILR